MTAQEVEALYLAHRRYLYALARTWCPTEQDREDAVAEVYAKLFHVTATPITRAYLATMLTNLCRDRWRTTRVPSTTDPLRARRYITHSEAQGSTSVLLDEVLGFRSVCFTEPSHVDPIDALIEHEQNAELQRIVQEALVAVMTALPLSGVAYFIHAYRHHAEVPLAPHERSRYSRTVEQEAGVTTAAVKSRIWRARSFLRKYLLEHHPAAVAEYLGDAHAH